MFRHAAFLIASMLSATTAAAGTVRISVTELLGDYAINSFEGGVPFGRQVNVNTVLSHFGSERATIELKGSIKHGKVRGDGILRGTQEAILDGGFRTWFQPTTDPMDFDLGLSLLPDGDFALSWTYSIHFQPGIDDFPCPGCEPRFFEPSVSVNFWPSWQRLTDEIPFLDQAIHRAEDGLIVTEPANGTVTEAYLVIEHRFIPEPSTIVVAAAGALLFVGVLLRRRRLIGNGRRRSLLRQPVNLAE